MKDKGDLSILTILLAKVGPMFTKKSLNFAEINPLSSVIVPSGTWNFVWHKDFYSSE